MRRLIVILLVICQIPFISTRAQDDDELKHELRLLARPTSDSIMLRWAPTTYRLWLVGNKYGYNVTRTLMYKDGKLLKNRKAVLLNKGVLKPRPLSEWEVLDERDEYAGVAAQAIYGDGFEVESGEENMGIMDIYNKATEQENRYGFSLFAADQSVEVAQYHGLMLVDKNVKPGEKYLYKVFPDYVPEDMKKDTAFFFTGVDEYLPLPAPAQFKAEGGDGTVTLTWDNKYQTDYFNSFWLERSDDGGDSFKRLNSSPAINTTPEGRDEAPYHYYLDTIPDNNIKYLYRVIGISIFGELSPSSEVVEVQGVDAITSVPHIVKKYSKDGKTVVLEWEFPNESKDRVEGFRIFRSADYAKGFKLLADSVSVMSKKYQDKRPLATGYYRMQAFNSHGGGGYSIPQMFQVVDSFPPAKPKGLEATIDTTGLVSLSWQVNLDQDIDGYRIYRANALHEEFSAITPEPVSDTTFMDKITIKTLTEKVYYKIKAYDKSQNQSDFSEVLELDRPDIVPPAAPLIRKIFPSDTGIVINWANSPSSDVEKVVLYRNRQGGANWEVIKVLSVDNTSQYVDVPKEAGFIYRYLIIAVDEVGNESKPGKPVAAKYNPKKQKDDWIHPEKKESKKKRLLTLTWEVPVYPVKRFIIYARMKDGDWKMIDGVEGNEFSYESTYYYGKGLEFIVKPK
ncbi:fibronectin type III domain-containing protein [Labilibacter marinus]|uniref:fibronectin type III domain-containing protein n=1 Tax=Labilibacter marinus TaxID=1477105 RepID=UPI00117B0F14|nr:hypothetical protein [Labilibacter marinus]